MKKKILSILLTFAMLVSLMPTALAAPPAKKYVSLGASQTAGYGLAGYLVEDVEVDPLAGNKAEMNVYGFDRAPQEAYPALVANMLDMDLEQKAISSMRIEELRFLLDETYPGDDYMDWRFYDVFDNGYDWGNGPHDWFVTAGKEAAGNTSLSDEAALAALRADYKDAIKNAEVISLELGLNNFGVYAFNNIKTILSDELYATMQYWHPEKEFYFAPDFDLIMDVDEQINYQAIKSFALEQLSANMGGMDASMMTKMDKIADVLTYAVLGYCYNFDIVMEKIYDLNPDAQVVVVGIQNMMHGVKLELNDMELPLGDVYREMIDLANMYTASGSPYAEKYCYADVGEHATTFLDEILAWNGDVAALSDNMKACFDMYADQLYVRSIIEYMMVGTALSTVFESLRNTAAGYGLEIFKNDSQYTYEFAFDTSTLDPSTLDLTNLDLENPDTALEYYGAAVSKHLKNIRAKNYDAYDYAFDAVLANLQAQKVELEALKDALPVGAPIPSDIVDGLAFLNNGINVIVPTAQADFKAALEGVYNAYEFTLNNAYENIATILQAAAAADTMVLSSSGMDGYNAAVSTLTSTLSSAIIDGSTQNFTCMMKKAGLSPTGPDAPYPFELDPDLFADPAVATVALMFVRFELGSAFFVHPSEAGHAEMAADIFYALKNNVSGDEFTKEKMEIYIPAAYKLAYSYAKENGYIDMAKGYIDTAIEAVREAEGYVQSAEVPAELGATKALLQEELANTIDTLEKTKALLDINELNADTFAQILAMEDELYIHLDTIEKLGAELDMLDDLAITEATSAAEFYASVIEGIVLNAYDNLVAEAENFAQEYLEIVDTIVAAVNKVSPALGAVVREYLTATPAEAIAIMYAAGEDAIDEFVAAAINLSNDVETIIAGLSAILESDADVLVKAIATSDEVAAITARIYQVNAELEGLYAQLRANPINEALTLEAKIAVAETQLMTLQSELVNAIIAIIEEEVNPATAEMVKKAFVALGEAVEAAEAAGAQYGEWFAGRFDQMAGDLLNLIINNTEKYGFMAGKIIDKMIWDFLNDVKEEVEEDVKDFIENIEIADIDLSEVEAVINELKAATGDIRAMLATVKKYAGPEVSGMIADLEDALDQVDDYADQLQVFAGSIEDLVNKIEDETDLTIAKVMDIVAQAEKMAAEAEALIAGAKASLAMLGQIYEVVMPNLMQYVEEGSPADGFIDTTAEKVGTFVAVTEAGYESTVTALEVAAANIEKIVGQVSADVCTSVAVAIVEISEATEIAAIDIIDAADGAIAVIMEQAEILANSSDAEIRKAGEQILALEFIVDESALIAKCGEAEVLVNGVIAALESVKTVEDAEVVLPQAYEALEALYVIAQDIYAIAEGDALAAIGQAKDLAQAAQIIAGGAAGNIAGNAAASYAASANAVIEAAGTAGKAVQTAVAAYEQIVVAAAGEIVTTVTEAAEDISAEVTVVVNTADVAVRTSIQKAEECAEIIDAFEYALYDATHGEYDVNCQSYYVSLGDSTVTGYGADMGANPEGYGNLGYQTLVPASFPYKLAEKLGLDVNDQYLQLAMAGLRTNDLLFILDETKTPDDYFTKRVLEQYIKTAGGSLDAVRETYKTELAKADLVTLSIGNCNFTGVQETGIIAKWLNSDPTVQGLLNNKYIGADVEAAIRGFGINLDAPAYSADWDSYLSEAAQDELHAAIEEIKGALIANGIPEEVTIYFKDVLPEDLAELVNPSLYLVVPVADLATQFIEWYAYCYASHAFSYELVLDKLHEMTRDDAQIVVVGMFNPMDELVITFEGQEIPVGEYIDYALSAVNLSAFVSAMVNTNTTYVSVPDTESVADADMAQTGNTTFELLEFLTKYGTEVNGNFTNHHETPDGHTYIAERIYDALTVTNTTHVWGEATYTWAEDGSSCTAERVCTKDSSHVETADATITSAEKIPATCTEKGTTTYTATFDKDWAETQTKDVEDIAIDADAHTWGTWAYVDGDNHKRVCTTNSAHVEIVAHVYDDASDAICNDNCGFVRVTGLTLNKGTTTLSVGGTETLSVIVTPDNATNKTVTWTSSKPAVATVDENGKVTAIAVGSATISANVGPYTVNCVVTVEAAGGAGGGAGGAGGAGGGAGGGAAVVTKPVNPFTDVDEDDYWYDAVLWAVEKGITNGITPTTFAPNEGCTRGQMVTFLWRAAGSPAPKTTACPFTDVDKDAYFYDAVLWAVEKGVTQGVTETTFEPYTICSRAHMVTFISRFAKGTPDGDSNNFVDVPENVYYTDSVQWAVETGVTNGTTATTFSPNNPCTRGQMVTFLYRHFEK